VADGDLGEEVGPRLVGPTPTDLQLVEKAIVLRV
jgi:hypothetical protein